MWAIDLTHSTHSSAQTGIQQVCRNLARILESDGTALPVVHDRYSGNWRPLDAEERLQLHPDPARKPARKRSSSWSSSQKLRGRWARWSGWGPRLPGIQGLFCPELFDTRRDSAIFGENLPPDAPRLAYFHDAIALKFPQWTPKGTVERFPAYLGALARFDHVACISRSSESDLQAFWAEGKIEPKARTSVVSLGLRQYFGEDRPAAAVPGHPVVLMVGTLEARKNHLALLEACETLWNGGFQFELRLAGMLNRETGAPAAAKVAALAEAGHPVTWEGAVSNQRLAELYSEATVFTYPSLYEGFGLPVLEALAHGLPVLMTTHGALGDLAGKGCLTCDGSPVGIGEGLKRLISEPGLRQLLAEEASRRTMRLPGELSAALLKRPGN
jgi:glycosyltransferase involved in cell wall biosynthesis